MRSNVTLLISDHLMRSEPCQYAILSSQSNLSDWKDSGGQSMLIMRLLLTDFLLICINYGKLKLWYQSKLIFSGNYGFFHCRSLLHDKIITSSDDYCSGCYNSMKMFILNQCSKWNKIYLWFVQIDTCWSQLKQMFQKSSKIIYLLEGDGACWKCLLVELAKSF